MVFCQSSVKAEVVSRDGKVGVKDTTPTKQQRREIKKMQDKSQVWNEDSSKP